jgi:hypothetical protein
LSASTLSLVRLGVVEGGVRELTIVVLLVETALDVLGDTEEVLEEEGVGVVHVEVVLEVLEHVHVFLDELVASNSGEGESLVIELPGVHVHLSLTTVLAELGLNVLSVGPVSDIEGSGEHVNLVLELFLGLIKVDARSLELDEINDTLIIGSNDGEVGGLEGLKSGGLNLGGGAEESNKSEILH